ncbi:MAG: oligosaccharide flippase family protein [Phycisphaerales bacterium]|nr:oligosaccharide flippase family protein [Phycisphaerales bacterium]
MGSKQLLKDLSANTIQTGITQLVGLFVFYMMSRFITKQDFGAYNWANAVGATIIAIASLGLDLVLVKRVAAGQDARLMAAIHFFHTLIIAIAISISLIFIQILWPHLLAFQSLFFLVVLQLILSNIANSFKFSLTGLESFKYLAFISTYLNFSKLIVVIVLLLGHFFTIQNIVIGFIASAIVELLVSYYFVSRKIGMLLKPIFVITSYKDFVLESLPQLGVVLFDTALTRIDWILLGIMSTVTITAEYSFAYKFFELSKLPLLILAPVLLTRFSKLFQSKEGITTDKLSSIQQFFNLEIFVSLLIPVFMICTWTDLIDFITNGKYGAVNQTTYSILACCVPIHFVINFLWTMGFVQGQLKEIMWITILSSLTNLMLNIFLIPRYGSIGAAFSFLLTNLLQFAVYLLVVRQQTIRINLSKPALLFLGATCSIFLAQLVFKNNYIAGFAASFFYLIFSLSFGLVSIRKSAYH